MLTLQIHICVVVSEIHTIVPGVHHHKSITIIILVRNNGVVYGNRELIPTKILDQITFDPKVGSLPDPIKMGKLTSDTTPRNIESLDLASLRTILIDEICEKTMCDEGPLLKKLFQMTFDTNSRSEDISMLGFRDCEKVNEIPDIVVPLIITDSVTNHTIFILLVNDGS